MTHETAAAIKAVSERLTEVERKLDNYFKMLHDQNAKNIEILAMAADDQMASRGIGLYPTFDEVVNTKIKKGTRVSYQDVLYKYIGDENAVILSTWNPIDATSVWEAISEHAGTLEDPIPWAMNMKCYKGKYYTWDNALYLCTNDSGIALAYTPDQLIGHFFEVV